MSGISEPSCSPIDMKKWIMPKTYEDPPIRLLECRGTFAHRVIIREQTSILFCGRTQGESRLATH